jgi:TorA maturation chaperone TorD
MKKSQDSRHNLAECRASLYGLLSSTYLQIPGKKNVELTWAPARKLLAVTQKGTEKPRKEIEKGLKLIGKYDSDAGLLSNECLINLLKDWTRLFRGVDKTGPLPPYESLYRSGRLQGQFAQEINRLFSKMGVGIPEEWRQPPDYIGVELDFMRFLCEKELHRRDYQQLAIVQETVELEKTFLKEHLGLWVPAFCKKMLEQAREDYYRGIAHLTLGLVEFDRIWVFRFRPKNLS